MWLDSIQWTSIKPGCCRLIHLIHLLLKNQLMQLSFLYLLQIYKNKRPRKVRSLAWCYRNCLFEARIRVLHILAEVSFYCSTIVPRQGTGPRGNCWFFWEGQLPGGLDKLDRRHHLLDMALRDNEYFFLYSLILDDPLPIWGKGSFEEKIIFPISCVEYISTLGNNQNGD